jgi:hypothetical protein
VHSSVIGIDALTIRTSSADLPSDDRWIERVAR